MDKRYQPDVDHAGTRPAQPPPVCRPLDTQGSKHGQGLDGDPALRQNASHTSTQATDHDLGIGGASNAARAATARPHAANPHGVEAVGVKSRPAGAPMAGQVSHDAPRHITRRRSRGNSRSDSDGSVNPQAILLLLERQQYRCALTDRALTPDTASLDHIVPLSRGGEHTIGNTQALDRTVNRAKGTLTNDEFIALCGEVWRHTQVQHGEHNQDSQSQN